MNEKTNQQVTVKTEYKVKSDYSTVDGYASVFNNVDSYGDVVLPGAFLTTVAERVPAGKVKFLFDHGWGSDYLGGTVTKAAEDSKGLQFEAGLSQSPAVQQRAILMSEGHLDGCSFGYDVIRLHFPEEKDLIGGKIVGAYLDELRLWEISAVVFGANDQASIDRVKAAVPDQFRDLPLAPFDHVWDYDQAMERVKSWVGEKRHRSLVKAHAGVAERDYLIADVIGGELVAVPAAISAVAGIIENERNYKHGDGVDFTALSSVFERLSKAGSEKPSTGESDLIEKPNLRKARVLELKNKLSGGFSYEG